MPDGFELNWKGEEVLRIAKENGAAIISEFALEVEGESKRELRRGNAKKFIEKHGVATGTLRRSIHTALPGYNWSGDDVEASPGTPERGRQKIILPPNKIAIQVGSGLKYALPVHQGHHGFVGYHYLTIGLQRAKDNKLAAIIARHKVQR